MQNSCIRSTELPCGRGPRVEYKELKHERKRQSYLWENIQEPDDVRVVDLLQGLDLSKHIVWYAWLLNVPDVDLFDRDELAGLNDASQEHLIVMHDARGTA